METNHDFLQTGSQPVSDRMRELLARAAQDHVYEQRSQSQVLDEIRQRLEGMEWLLRDIRERELGGLTGQLESVRGQVDELSGIPPEWAEGLAEHIAAFGERVKPVAELPALWADVGVVSENVDEGLARTQAVLDAAQHIADATRRTAQRIDELAERSERLEHAVAGVTARVDRALGELAERMEHGLAAAGGRVEGVGGRLDGLDGRLDGVDGRLEGVAGRLEGLDGRLDGVAERVARLPAALDITELHRLTREIAQRPDTGYGDRFDALEKHLAEAGGIQEDVAGQVRAVHGDVRKRLATLEETMLALAEALLRPRRERE